MKTVLVLILMFGLAACSSGGGSGSTTGVAIDTSLYEDPSFVKPTTSAGAEQTLRGAFISVRDADNWLSIDNAGNWSFQLESGRYRVVNGQQILSAYTYQSGGKTPTAVSLTDEVWLFTFDVDTYPQYAPFDGVYDDTHNRLAIRFLSETCVVIQVKALNQTQYDVYCK